MTGPNLGHQFGHQPVTRPRRPAVLLAASLLWVLYGATFVVFGALLAASPWLPALSEIMSSPGRVNGVVSGLTAVGFGVLIIALGVFVLTAATWARVLVTVVAVLIAIPMHSLIVFPLLAIIAGVLQFLPAVSRYAAATR